MQAGAPAGDGHGRSRQQGLTCKGKPGLPRWEALALKGRPRGHSDRHMSTPGGRQ